MEKICIITDSLKSYTRLKPVIQTIQKDPNLQLTLLTADRHTSTGIELTAAWIQCGDEPVRQSIDICLPQEKNSCSHAALDQAYFSKALTRIDPEIVLIYGTSHISFTAAVAASLKNIPIAHIHGGQANFGLWDDTLGFGITKMAQLHFTSCEAYRQRVIGSGEHPNQVFNVGALHPGYLLDSNILSKEKFYQSMDLDSSQEFFFISMTPDRSLGSKNQTLAASLMTAMEAPCFNRFTWVCQDPGPKGFGQIIKQQMDMFLSRHPGKIRFIKDDTNIPGAMAHCRAMIGNTDACVTQAAYFKTGVVCIGNRLKDRNNPGHMIQADMIPGAITKALQRIACPLFQVKLMLLNSPFEQRDTPGQIKEIIKYYGSKDVADKNFNYLT